MDVVLMGVFIVLFDYVLQFWVGKGGFQQYVIVVFNVFNDLLWCGVYVWFVVVIGKFKFFLMVGYGLYYFMCLFFVVWQGGCGEDVVDDNFGEQMLWL